MPEGGAALGRNRWFPGAIRPKKECIKPCEACFAKNALNFLIRVQAWNEFVSPKFYSPLANWPWLRISPGSSLYVIYCLMLTAWQWLMSFTCIPVQTEPIKAHWGKVSWSFSFERSATFPPQADHVLVDLFSSAVDGGLWGQRSPTVKGNFMWWRDIVEKKRKN